jgi:hypothetical protein
MVYRKIGKVSSRERVIEDKGVFGITKKIE